MKLKIDGFNVMLCVIITVTMISLLGLAYLVTEYNGAGIIPKIDLKTFESWDCDLQFKYLASTVPANTHRESYIHNCMENQQNSTGEK